MSVTRSKRKEYCSEENLLALLESDSILRQTVVCAKQSDSASPEAVDQSTFCREQGARIAERILGNFDIFEPVIPGVPKRSAIYDETGYGYYACRIRLDNDKPDEKIPEEIVECAFQMLRSAADAEEGLRDALASTRRAVDCASIKELPPEGMKVYAALDMGAEICTRSSVSNGMEYAQPTKPLRRPFLTLMIETSEGERQMKRAVCAVEHTAKYFADLFEDSEVPFA